MPFSTACSTSLSNFEAQSNYKDVDDPAVMVAFPVEGDADGASLVAWTTTPWTLPSNVALCVHPDLVYVKVGRRCACILRLLATALPPAPSPRTPLLFSSPPRTSSMSRWEAPCLPLIHLPVPPLPPRPCATAPPTSLCHRSASHSDPYFFLSSFHLTAPHSPVYLPPPCPFSQVRDPVKNRVYIVAETRLPFLPGAVAKAAKKGKEGDKPQVGGGLPPRGR